MVDYLSNLSGETVGIDARISAADQMPYFALWSQAVGGWQLFKTLAGASTQLGTKFADTFASGSGTVRRTVSDTTICLGVGSKTVLNATNSSIIAA